MLSKVNFHKLNGWQRLFVFFAILWTIGFIADYRFDLPKYVDVNNKEDYRNYVSANLDKYLPKKESPPSFEVYLNSPTEIMSDGVVLPIYNHSREQVAEAYEKFKADPQNLNPNKGYFIAIAKELGLLLIKYVLPLVSIYLFGWMIGWVVRGFKKQP
jgi:hypothetical protein